ncbi:MAG: MBG domain-containing protein [Collinsella sp.]|nr:MBG domain-containing protein [Collinsella sp.]
MREKKMRMRRLAACVLAAALALGGAATTLATPTVAEAYPQGATFPIRSKDDLSYYEKDKPVVLEAGEDYVLTGKVDIDYYEVQGGTAENPTRLYFSNDSYLGGPLTDMRNKTYYRRPLFVVTGGYVEFIGDSGAATEVVCNGKTFLGDSAEWNVADKPNTGKKLNLSVKDLTLVSNLDRKCDRAILLYGTMGRGETASFTNVNVSNWNCVKNGRSSYSNDKSTYTASPAPVTIRGSHVAVDATFTNCTFSNNADDCVGALSVVGRNAKPRVTLSGCMFENNYQSMIACDYLKVEDNHVHSGNIVVRNADLSVKNCSIRSKPSASTTSWNGPCEYMYFGYKMHMTSGIAVAKDASCTIESSTIDDSYVSPYYSDYGQRLDIQDPQRCAVYALGSVTLAGNTKVTTAKAKGVDASDVGSYGKVHVDKSFTGEAVLSIDDTKFDPESNKQYYYYEYVDLGTSDLSQEDLASRLKLANENLAYDVTDGKVKVIHRKHEHEWAYSANRDGYSIAATCNGQYEASHCVYSRDGETISLMSSKRGDLSFTYNGKQRDAVLATTKPSQKDNAVAQGKVTIVSARFYRFVDENDTVGIEMEGSQPCNAGTYRVVATVAIEGQSDVTLERVFKIDGIKLSTCKVEVLNNDTVKNNLPAFKWTGEKIAPQFKVTTTVDGETVDLRLGVDYEFDQDRGDRDGTDPGTYRTWLWGLGNFVYGQSFYWSIYGTQFENVQAKGFDGTYDGKAHSPLVTVDNAPEGMQIKYSVDGGSLYEDRIPSYTNACAETIKYRITAPDYVPVEGELKIKIAPADQVAPKDVKTTAATGHDLADGSIDGIDNTYEWKAEAASDYQRIAEGETSVKGLAAGKYCVRLKADRNHNASEALTVEVKDGPKKADGSGWKHDAAEHWNICTCGKEDVDRAKHDFEWVVDQAATADKPGSKHERCKTCDYERESVEIPAFGIKGYSDEYDGAYHTVDATSLPEGATAKYSTDGKNWSPEAPKIKDVGTLTVSYEVTIDGVKTEGKVTLEVKPRAIKVTAQDASKTYGEADPVFTWDVTSGKLVAGETLQGLEIKREDSDSVRDGGYVLHLTQAKGANPNYNITFVDGVFTINQRLLTVAWGTTKFTYDGKEHCPVATLGNVIGKDDLGATVEGSQVEAGDSYQASLTALTGKAAGNYVLPTEGLTCDFSIKNAAQGAPVVQVAAETVSGKRDGKITGVDATMEWRAKGTDEYQAVDEGTAELTGLAAGTYEVRYQAKANYDASSATEVTVAAGPKLVVTLPSNQVGYALTSTATELDWHGTATLTMGIDSAYFAGKDYAVKVNGKAVKLSAKGTYELKDVEGDVNVTVEGVLKHEPDGSGWAHDAKNHWHICRCDDIIDKAEHTFRWVVDKPATTEAKGKKHQECTVCGDQGATEEIAILVPEIIDGKGQTMVVDAAKDLSFRSSAPLAFFQKVLVDDKEVAAENYVLTEGSTIVTLKASFLNTLGVGEHRLSVVSTTGTAETTFTVAEAAKPAPGQTTTTTTSKPKKRASKEALPESGDSTYVIAGAVLAAGVAVLLLAWAIMKRRA